MCWRDPAAGRSSTTRSCEYPGGGSLSPGRGARSSWESCSAQLPRAHPSCHPQASHTHIQNHAHTDDYTRTHTHTRVHTWCALFLYTCLRYSSSSLPLVRAPPLQPVHPLREAAPQRTQRPGLRLVLWERLGSERHDYLDPRCLGRPGAGRRRGQPGVWWKGGEGGGLTVRSDQVELGATPGGGAGVAEQGELAPGRAARLRERRKHASPPPRSFLRAGTEPVSALVVFLATKGGRGVCVWKEGQDLGTPRRWRPAGAPAQG